MRSKEGNAGTLVERETLAREICLRALTVRARSKHELTTLLARRGFESDVVESVLCRLESVGLINDEQFAHDWVEQRQRHQHRSAQTLRQELRLKGIESEVIDASVGEISDDEQLASAVALVEKKLRVSATVAPDVLSRRILGMLARRGFSAEIASRALQTCLTDDAVSSE